MVGYLTSRIGLDETGLDYKTMRAHWRNGSIGWWVGDLLFCTHYHPHDFDLNPIQGRGNGHGERMRRGEKGERLGNRPTLKKVSRDAPPPSPAEVWGRIPHSSADGCKVRKSMRADLDGQKDGYLEKKRARRGGRGPGWFEVQWLMEGGFCEEKP